MKPPLQYLPTVPVQSCISIRYLSPSHPRGHVAIATELYMAMHAPSGVHFSGGSGAVQSHRFHCCATRARVLSRNNVHQVEPRFGKYSACACRGSSNHCTGRIALAKYLPFGHARSCEVLLVLDRPPTQRAITSGHPVSPRCHQQLPYPNRNLV